jgi:ribonuclease HI
MRVDRAFIELGMQGDTLNKAQFEILGQPYPPNEGWEHLVLERELTTKDTNLFLLLRGKLALKAQEQIVKNYILLATFHNNKEKNSKENASKEQDSKEQDSKEKSVEVSSNRLEIYCDGACKGNPGASGSGLAIYQDNANPILLYGKYEKRGTNNTAELNALYKALVISKEANVSEVTILCDSKYSIDSITNWAYGWKSRGWKKKGGEIKNLEIIKLAHELYNGIKDRVRVKHVKGHSGVEGNDLADSMAVYAIASKSKEYQQYDYKRIDEVLNMIEG